MNASNVFPYALGLFVAFALLFNAIYFFVVLPKVRSVGKDVGLGAFVNIYQSRYIKIYWEALTEQEKRKWYNLIIKHSPFIGVLIWCVCAVLLLFTRT